MSPRTPPSRKISGRTRVHKVTSPGCEESAESTPPHVESIERSGKNLGLAYLDDFKRKVKDAEEDEAACMNQIIHLKNTVAMDENALDEAKKSLRKHNEDLEALFKSKHDASVNGDTEYVNSVFHQINAVAKTVADTAETVKELERLVQQSKNNVDQAQTEILPNLTSFVSDRQCNLVDAISKVGLFPRHVLRKLPGKGPLEELYPYCCRAYVEGAYVPLSCGCRYHPLCMRVLILSGQINCLACGARPHGTWMAYWGFSLGKEMARELDEHRARSSSNEEWVEAPLDRMGSCILPINPEPLAAIDPTTAVIPLIK